MANHSVPYRQIRAHQTSTTITVYQAYNFDIAGAAVEHQKLDASPSFSTTRMTWIKPSWAWMLYRSGYSYKDRGQEHILALNLTQAAFKSLLRKAVVSTKHGEDVQDSGARAKREGRDKPTSVRVQWDPERTIKLEKLWHRSIQIGIPGAHVKEFVQGIVSIEDVTAKARELKKVLDTSEHVNEAYLVSRGLVPEEIVFEVDAELRRVLRMDDVSVEGGHE